MTDNRSLKEIQAALKESGIEARKLPRQEKLRIQVPIEDRKYTITVERWNNKWHADSDQTEDLDRDYLAVQEECAAFRAQVCAALDGVTSEDLEDECMDENSSIEEAEKQQEIEAIRRDLALAVAGDEKDAICGSPVECMDEEIEGQFYQFGPDGQIHEGQDLETFLSETSLQDFFPGCVVEVEEDASTEITGKALTLKQPWAWAITQLGKNIENRSWPTKYRGELYIHAGVGWDSEGPKWIAQKFGIEVPSHSELPSGVLVAKCHLTDCRHWTETSGEELPWSNESGFQWFLEDIEPIEPHLPLQGKLGIFSFSVSPDNASKDSPAKALCQALNLKIEPYGLTTRQHNEDLIEVCLQDECFCWISQETGPWEALEFLTGHKHSDKMKAVKEALKQFLDPDAKAKFDLINRIHFLSSQMGCEPGGIARKITGKNLSSCSLSELEFIFNRLAQLSQIVGLDNSEPIPEEELDDGEKAANDYGKEFINYFLNTGTHENQIDKGDEEAIKRRYSIQWIHRLAKRAGVAILPNEAEFLADPEECPLTDLRKIIDRLVSLPPTDVPPDPSILFAESVRATCQRNGWEIIEESETGILASDDDDYGEPINYRPYAV
jgi:hypothetical protein